jgi:O-antigen/teichoic acid export membrane protein
VGEGQQSGTLRELVLRGTTYLTLRQALSMGIGIVGVVVLTRQIGPSDYGRYVGSLAIVTFLTAVTRIGVDTYVIRRPEEPDRRTYRVTFTLMLVNGCAALALGVLLAPQTIGRLIGEEFVGPFQALLVALPLSLLLAPGLASLERDLRYRRVAFVELLNTVVFYGVAVTLAITEPTVWAPVVGYLAAQAVSLVVTIVASRFPVGLAWSRAEVREIVRFGTPLTLAAACMEGRRLVNPVVVGGLLGPAAVGVVGLALRVTEMLRFVSAAGYRVSVSVLSRLVGDAGRLSRAVSEGMFLQILGVAPLLVGFAVASGWIVPLLLGSSWDETVTVFPPIAAGALLMAFMSLQSSLLYVVGRGTDVLFANLAGLVLLAAGAAVAIRVWDSPVAYGVGELASVAGLWFVHRAARRFVSVDYRAMAPWLAASLTPLAFPWIGLPWGLALLLPPVVLLSRPATRARLRPYLRQLAPGRSGRAPER